MSDWATSLAARVKPLRPLNVGESVWIFGTGLFGRAVASACVQQGVRVAGFVQTLPAQSEVEGLPVRGWSQLTEADLAMPLLIGIYNRVMPLNGLAQLARKVGCQRVVMPWHIYAQFASQLGWRYWLADPAFLLQNLDALSRTHARLADDVSRQCFEQLVAFRLGLNDAYAGFTHTDAQYFNELSLPHLKPEGLSYLDGGAYNGDSFIDLLGHRQVGQAWLFEPDKANFAKLCQTVRWHHLPGLCLPLALADCYRLLRFNTGLGEAGNVHPDGDEGIATVAIDEFLAGAQLDLLKLDVEGSEVAALRGAAQTLRDSRPVLAISGYHRPEDLWVIPDVLAELCTDYRLHMRQHTHNSFDLVIYAVPA
ncbi:FkbM family methyltransferase [Rhodoferax antarcticus]|uniref:FkbM family methyltransferase n=1 Tax=Rhodoferax antarcticus TaxID=81479 RepID=UPI00094FCDEF|nr:FkbM family methyltransferase [Rhodoferax antarcticus]APW45625.1 hypothetical protein RA876_03675 [Rhodoferax antarcticus]